MTLHEINTGDTAWVLISAALVLLMTPALAYLGLRTLDGWAPYSKASGDKVAGAITALLPGKK